jgi:hypothetical protein
VGVFDGLELRSILWVDLDLDLDARGGVGLVLVAWDLIEDLV